MPAITALHCIVDDTALITNINEIESWVMRSAINLIVPLHTIERLHLLKKDASQIGQNARKAVKFLDDITSHTDLANAVVIQEAEERYATWAEVEAHYIESKSETAAKNESHAPKQVKPEFEVAEDGDGPGALSQVLLEKLNISKDPTVTSPLSTPPLSPSSSEPQSSKTSPELKSAAIAHEISPVPPSLKDLINSIVWYTHEKCNKTGKPSKDLIFLTNSSDTSYLARDFGVIPKNIHQLRASIGVEEQEIKSHDKHRKKHRATSIEKKENEPKTLFRYDDEESEEDEEVVFKPRTRGTMRGTTMRGSVTGSVRSKNGRGHGHSPANSLSAPAPLNQNKPQIPTEEIDPDSFDRGSFARGNTSLVSVGTQQFSNQNRGNSHRNLSSASHSRGVRGGTRGSGSDRGAARGRGRLFVP